MDEKSLQKIAVLVGTSISAAIYGYVRAHGVEVDSTDKFWFALPAFASLAVTNKCVVGRIVRLVARKKRVN